MRSLKHHRFPNCRITLTGDAPNGRRGNVPLVMHSQVVALVLVRKAAPACFAKPEQAGDGVAERIRGDGTSARVETLGIGICASDFEGVAHGLIELYLEHHHIGIGRPTDAICVRPINGLSMGNDPGRF